MLKTDKTFTLAVALNRNNRVSDFGRSLSYISTNIETKKVKHVCIKSFSFFFCKKFLCSYFQGAENDKTLILISVVHNKDNFLNHIRSMWHSFRNHSIDMRWKSVNWFLYKSNIGAMWLKRILFCVCSSYIRQWCIQRVSDACIPVWAPILYALTKEKLIRKQLFNQIFNTVVSAVCACLVI